jgi:hypothetical protein
MLSWNDRARVPAPKGEMANGHQARFKGNRHEWDS